EEDGGGAADAAVAAGHDRDLALQPARSGIARLPFGLGLKLRLVAGHGRFLARLRDMRLVESGGLVGHGDRPALWLRRTNGRAGRPFRRPAAKARRISPRRSTPEDQPRPSAAL